MVQTVDINPKRTVMDLLHRFGSLSFRHLLAITDLSTTKLKHVLHDLIIHGKILKNTEIAPKEGIIVFYEAISDDSTTTTWTELPQQDVTGDISTDDPEHSVLSTSV